MRKKTRDQYSREKFKKKYNFVPDKPGSNKGMITVNGEKRHVDMGKSRFVTIRGQLTDRQSAADIYSKNGDIILDKSFFKVKNSKRRDALLQHEFGHTKLHSLNADSETADPRSFSQKNRGIARRTAFDTTKEALKNFGFDTSSKDTKKMINDALDASIGKSDKRYNDRSNKNQYRKKRDELLTHAGKYRNKTSYHANEEEFEADRYSANKSGLKNMKRGMNDYNKQNKKMYKKMRLNKELIKNFNKQCDADSKSRSKALKDTKLRDADLYK